MRSSEMSESQLRAAVNQLVDEGTITEAQIGEALAAKVNAALSLAAELGLSVIGEKSTIASASAASTSAAAGTARPRTTKSSARLKAASSNGNGSSSNGKAKAAARKSRPSAAVTAARKLQGQYMGLIRNVTGKDKERFKAVAAEKGKAVAIFQLRRYHADRA